MMYGCASYDHHMMHYRDTRPSSLQWTLTLPSQQIVLCPHTLEPMMSPCSIPGWNLDIRKWNVDWEGSRLTQDFNQILRLTLHSPKWLLVACMSVARLMVALRPHLIYSAGHTVSMSYCLGMGTEGHTCLWVSGSLKWEGPATPTFWIIATRHGLFDETGSYIHLFTWTLML